MAVAGKLQAGALEHLVPASVVLAGGPMDGWVVTPDAAALRPDWWRTWPRTIAARFKPGRYGPPAPDGRLIRSSWQANA